MQVKVRELGLAGYLKSKKCKLIGYIDDHFVFETEKTKEVWEIEYLNSCCFTHDNCIMTLRKLMKRKIFNAEKS